jgi:hypothetical protein
MCGSALSLSGGPRDYLGVITAIGPGRDLVERSVMAARAAYRWDIGS